MPLDVQKSNETRVMDGPLFMKRARLWQVFRLAAWLLPVVQLSSAGYGNTLNLWLVLPPLDVVQLNTLSGAILSHLPDRLLSDWRFVETALVFPISG